METLQFTVDSKLLRELGERLVGRPHIALAELIKNSYDADASEVVIRFLQDRIEVEDDGHGMTYSDFRDKWLRIGSAHKEREETSPRLQRALTGSKGVGRLSVQLLANKLEIRSIAGSRPPHEVVVYVDWDKAIEAGDLTRAPVMADRISPETSFINGSETGTRLILTELQHSWSPLEFEELAREIWPLQSPFRDEPSTDSFRVTLESPYRDVVRRFDSQMQAVLDLWIAKVEGELLPVATKPPQPTYQVLRAHDASHSPETDHDEEWDTAADFGAVSSVHNAPSRIVRLTLERHGEKPEVIYYELENCHIDELKFQIRVFNLAYRQPRGVRVQEARSYLRRFGGVHIYDTEFHLPYYGPDTDWLHIEIDHSHRLSRSRLLPMDLQRPDGMTNLPTNSRLFGTVHVNTAHEQRVVGAFGGRTVDALAIQVSRDRLTETAAYRDLVLLVRWAIDYYSMNVVRRSQQRAQPPPRPPRPDEKPSTRIRKLKQTLQDHRDDLPPDAFEDISEEVDRALEESEAQAERYESYLGLLGALATAGISALAYEHEVSKQFEMLNELAGRLDRVSESADTAGLKLSQIADGLRQWIQRAQSTHSLFAYLLHPSNREIKGRFRARKTLEDISAQVKFLSPDTKFDFSSVPDQMRLPKGRYAEWSAIFQNIFVNSFNAMKRSRVKRIDVSGTIHPNGSWILVQDTGVGVDLERAERLFDPFVRDLELDSEYGSPLLGGGGLGLTIVRMTADDLNCDVEFIQPDTNHAAAIRVVWKE